jgi:NAD(P)-dependent dehydrogenase (short-subunit alcohol dehydrogenase family)
VTRSVLVVGASRGIGLELVRQYAGAGWSVHATSRRPEDPGELGSIGGDVTVHRVEVRDPGTVRDLAGALGRSGVDVLIHNAGVKDGVPRDELWEINVEAPIRTIDLLTDAGVLGPGATVVVMSSRAGSRGGRRGSLGTYGDSKAALNDAFRARVPQWGEAGITAIAVHPGWVRTDMGGPGASVGVTESVEGIRRVIDGLTPADHGSFLTWQGREQPW